MISPMPSIATGSQAADAGHSRRRPLSDQPSAMERRHRLLLTTSAVSKDRPPGQLWQAAPVTIAGGELDAGIRPRLAPTTAAPGAAHSWRHGCQIRRRPACLSCRACCSCQPSRPAKHLEQSGGDLPIEHLVAKLAQCFIQLHVAVGWRPSVGLRLIGFRQATISRGSGFRRHPSDLHAQARDILESPTTRRQPACCGLMARLC